MALKKSTIIEAVASTPDKDVTNEILDIDGADISPLLEGRGFVNSDHRNDFAHLVGRVVAAKKISKAEDCETPYQIKAWNEHKKPFIWTKAEIWDGTGHKEADSIASIYKFYQSKNEEAPIKVSVEGKTLDRKGGVLKRTLIKGIALTVAPCNRKTHTEVVQMTKSLGLDANSLVKSEDAVPFFVETKENPLQKLFDLAQAAKAVMAQAKEPVQKSEEVELKSPALLERLKQMTAVLKGRTE
jgi:hypothetical protein